MEVHTTKEELASVKSDLNTEKQKSKNKNYVIQQKSQANKGEFSAKGKLLILRILEIKGWCDKYLANATRKVMLSPEFQASMKETMVPVFQNAAQQMVVNQIEKLQGSCGPPAKRQCQ